VARIVAPSGKEVAFARKGTDVHLIATETGTYRLMGPNGETDFAVNTPLLPAQRLKPSASEAGLIQSEPLREAGRELWRWLLVPVMILLWLEWWLFYSTRRKRQLAESLAVGPQVDNRILQEPSLDTDGSRERSEARDAKFVA
jgi:hypothetical protein